MLSTARLTSASISRFDGRPVTVTTAQRPSSVLRLRVSKPWMSPPWPHAADPQARSVPGDAEAVAPAGVGLEVRRRRRYAHLGELGRRAAVGRRAAPA